MNAATFRIVAKPFGYPMYASTVNPLGWSDRKDEAVVYDERDVQATKLKYWRANLTNSGVDASTIATEAA